MVDDLPEPMTPEQSELERKLKEPTKTIDRTLQVPVLVSDDMVCRIWRRLEQEAGQPVIICKTTDGRITSWRNLDEALAQANTVDKEIEGIYIKNEDSAKYGCVTIVVIAGGRIGLHVFSEERAAERLFADLETIIGRGIRRIPGYAWMAKQGNFAVRASVVLVFLYAFLKLPIPLVGIAASALERSNAAPLLVALFGTAAGFAVIWAIGSVVRMVTALFQRYWPMVALEIGNGKQMEQASSRVRKCIVGVIGALLLAAIGGLLTGA